MDGKNVDAGREKPIRALALALCATSVFGVMGAGRAFAGEPDQPPSPPATAPSAAGEQTAAQTDTTNAVDAVTVLGHAMRVSVGNVPLNVTEPTSVVPQGFIKNNIIPLASFDDIVKFQPSVFAQTPNGPGLGKNETLSIRGFQDGQYNVTFDGIPFGDASDLHHTSSALFISHDLAEAEVDRGPGTAATIGKATFGGTMGFRTKDPLDSFTVNPYATIGSWSTYAGGIEVESGATPYGRGYVDYQHETTDGFLTHSNERRSNFLAKSISQLTPHLTLTLLGTWNEAFEYTTKGATLAELQQFGPSFGLCDNPKLQCYYGYNAHHYYSDFEYADLRWDAGDGWVISNKLYSDAFSHSGDGGGVYTGSTDSTDTNPADVGYTIYDSTGKKIGTNTTDVVGKGSNAGFRAYGDTLRVSKAFSFGDLLFGIWYDDNHDHRTNQSYDLTTKTPINSKYGTSYAYDFKSDVGTTVQPYAEFDWKVTDSLTIKPGVKYTSFHRTIDAPFNATKPPVPLQFSATYDGYQPSISANYVIVPGWTAYVQAAKGFLAPPLAVFEVQTIKPLAPETTTNYQVGTSFRKGPLQFGADAYHIDFDNFLAQSQVNAGGTIGTQTTYVNAGSAVYQGVELEAQYAFGYGFSGYGNYSRNEATYKGTSVTVAETPKYLAAIGVLYDNRTGPYGSIVGKYVGPHYGLDNTTNAAGAFVFQDQYPIKSFFSADLAVGWVFRNLPPAMHMRALTTSLKIGNLFDTKKIDDYVSNQSVSGLPIYRVVPGRSAFFNVEASF